MVKSVAIAYILWFFFGWIGLHQFYLRRDKHAFFTWATLGGVFGISWLRDLFCIPRYTAAVNENPEYMTNLTEKMQKHPKPPAFGVCRWFASLLLGFIFGFLVYMAFWREDMHSRYMNLITTAAHIAVALGKGLPDISNQFAIKKDFITTSCL
jgi:DnaJ family protein C protein 22